MKGLYYIYAYYNPFWIYMGWWLYAAPVGDEPIAAPDRSAKWPGPGGNDGHVWLNYDWRLDALMTGLGLPVLHDYRGKNHTACNMSFLENYPVGVVCEVKDGGRQFIVQETDKVWNYNRLVREIQLDNIAKAAEEREKRKVE